MKILFITQWFQPEDFFKGVPFVKSLMRKGHHVEVLTGFPNYPSGNIYEGYKIKVFQKEIIEGINVVRVPLYPSHDNSSIKRMFNYLSFAITASIFGPFLVKKPDVIYVYHPPPTTYLPASVLKMVYRVPVVYDIQDFWPDTLAVTGMLNNKIALKLIDFYCRLFYKFANKIAVLSPGFKEKLINKGVDKDKISVIYNWFDESKILYSNSEADYLPEILTNKDKFKVLFAGNMGKAQSLCTVLDAACILRDNQYIQFVFVGDGVQLDNLKSRKNKEKLNNVSFLPRVSQEQIVNYLKCADVLLVHLKRDPLFAITIPSKIQSYMAAGKPILVGVEGDAATLVEKSKCGIPCIPEDPIDLSQNIVNLFKMPKKLLIEMGENGKDYYAKNLSIEIGVRSFERLFKEVSSIEDL